MFCLVLWISTAECHSSLFHPTAAEPSQAKHVQSDMKSINSIPSSTEVQQDMLQMMCSSNMNITDDILVTISAFTLYHEHMKKNNELLCLFLKIHALYFYILLSGNTSPPLWLLFLPKECETSYFGVASNEEVVFVQSWTFPKCALELRPVHIVLAMPFLLIWVGNDIYVIGQTGSKRETAWGKQNVAYFSWEWSKLWPV